MKSKFFVIVAIIALVGFVVTLDYGNVWAQQEAPKWEELEEGKYPIPVEFTTFPDVSPGGNPPPPEDLFTVPPDAAGTPYPGSSFTYPYGENQVDAIACNGDALLMQLIPIPVPDEKNPIVIGCGAVLLVSFEGDPMYTGTTTPIGPVAVYMECPGGSRSPKWNQKEPPPGKTHPFGLDKDALTLNPDHPLDALEVWSGQDYLADDANMYSLQGDPLIPGAGDPDRISVRRRVDDDNGPGYITHTDIVNAVQSLGYDGYAEDIDLDALMVGDWGGLLDGIWNDGDIIIFSIRKPPSGTWDGGEIVVLENRVAPAADTVYFLNHGGHLWDTAFDVATAFSLDPPTEEVDAIEAYPQQPRPQTPALTEWGLIVLVALLIISTVFVMLKRRKAVVRA